MLVNKDSFLIEVDKPQLNALNIKGINGSLLVDTDYNKYKHATQIGKVVATPIRLTPQYLNDTPINVGDTVVFHHFVCQPNNKVRFMEEEVYRADYFNIYGKVEGGKLIPIEDVFFVTPILEPEENMYEGVLQIKPHREYIKQYGIVHSVSSSLSNLGLMPGDKIFFTKNADYEMTISEELLYRMRTRNIVTIERDGELICLKDKLIVRQFPKIERVGVLLSAKRTGEQRGEVVRVGENSKGVVVGEVVSYFNGSSGTFEYKGETYSIIELRHINYVVNGEN
jgi:co-chaperonin GroES (HSP10)